MEKLVLIDGHSILNRAFYGVPGLTNSEGLHTNAVYGFLNILFKLLEEEKPGYLAVAFDLKAPTFRHTMYDAYKGTRKPMPEELHEQVPLMKEVLTAMGIPIFTREGYEADDILGTVAKKAQAAGMEVTVVSGDRDLLQLSDAHIKISIPKDQPWDHRGPYVLSGGCEAGVSGNAGAVHRRKSPYGRHLRQYSRSSLHRRKNSDKSDPAVWQRERCLRASFRGKASPGKKIPGGAQGSG